MRLFSDANYDFLGRRRKAYVLSAAVLALGVVAALVHQVAAGSWLNYGVDFTGGTLVQVEFVEATTAGEIRSALGGELGGDADITRFGSEREYLVRVPAFAEEGENISDRLDAALVDAFGEGRARVVRTEAVGPKIGAELQQKAIIAILISFALTLIYLAFRFEWRFGVAAVIATVHDIMVTMGVISAFQMEVSLPTVAAVLTIIGYSLNDTIIVFDRVRENVKKGGRRADYIGIVNRSINEVLPRTVMTSGTTLGALIALFALGGEIIRGFALILIIGIIVGTYSSIFVASPALLEIERRWKGRERPQGSPRAPRAAAV